MMTPSDVAEHTFHTSRFNGYSTEDVDNFMDLVTEDYTNLYKENAVLKNKMKVLVNKISEYRATEDDMRATLLTARKAAEAIVNEAEQKRLQMLAEAEEEVAGRRAELRQEIADTEAQLAAAKASTGEFIRGMRGLVQCQFDFLEKLPNITADTPAAPPDAVAEAAAAIDDSLSAMMSDEELAEQLKDAEAQAEADTEAAYTQEVPELENEPTRVIDLGENVADQDYQI